MAKKKSAAKEQFVILPARGVLATDEQEAQRATLLTLAGAVASSKPQEITLAAVNKARTASLGAAPKLATKLPAASVRVLDSISEVGAKLVEMNREEALALEALEPGLRIVPVQYYTPARAPRPAIIRRATTRAAAAATKIQVSVVSASDSTTPVKGANVVAFTDFQQGVGAQAKTNAQGVASLAFNKSSVKVERIYVFPERNFYGLVKKNLTLKSGTVLKLKPIVFPVSDALDHFFGPGKPTDGQGVVVGVIDTGCGPHPDLTIAGGENTVTGESPTDFHDGDQHGSHVAGIIAAGGKKPSGRAGIAPGAQIMSFRVFGKNSDGASNFAIVKAIQKAIAARCDVINMSLGGGSADPAITSAIADAREAGISVIVAAGNEGGPVSFPGSDDRSIAVAAFGRKDTFPPGTPESEDVGKPLGSDKKNFFATFSNFGNEISVVSTGVGIVSTVPGGYISMSGTSMACPAVAGAAARLLGKAPAILTAPRNQARSDAINQLIFAAAKKLGFGVQFEGHGFPR